MKNQIIKLLLAGLLLITIHQSMLPRINSILLLELMVLGTICYLLYRYLKNKGYAQRKESHFSDYRYNRPKAYKPWRDYRSKIEVSPKTWIDHQLEAKK